MASIYSLVIILLIFFICNAESADPSYVFCNQDAKINNSQTSANIDSLLAKLVSTTIQDGFSTASYGNGKNQVYGLAQCRSDISKSDCSSCIKTSAKEVRERCSKEADAVIWGELEYCVIRYDTEKFFGDADTSNGIIYYNVQNATEPEKFNKELGSLVNQIRKQAIAPANEGLGKGKKKLSDFITLYALAQCTRDLSELYCAQCLASAFGNFGTVCNNKIGCRSIYPSCYVRYEIYPFYFPLDPQERLGHASAKDYSSIVSKH